ncbi:MAG TPA: hypothetical protein VHX15_21675, partial [Frankiaceae bacterium]|nr:hypothetical protein [Frankiaceae bacterium]
ETWAEDAGVATTSLIQQIRALGSKGSTAALSAELRKTLATFTSGAFGQIGGLLADVPAGPLQSLTVSALGYLQRVDGVLGGNPATLIQQLPIPLSAIPNLSSVLPQLNLPAGLATWTVPSITSLLPGSGGRLLPTPLTSALESPLSQVSKAVGNLSIPSKIPTATVPSKGANGVAGSTLPTPSLGSVLNGLGGAAGTGAGGGLDGTVSSVTGGVGNTVKGVTGTVGNTVKGVTGSVGNTVKGVTGTIGNTVKGVTGTVPGSGGGNPVSGVTGTVGSTVNGVTSTVTGAVGTVTGGLTSGSGPALPLPTAVPTLPPLPSLPSLPKLPGLG